jgi:hypothetical protein
LNDLNVRFRSDGHQNPYLSKATPKNLKQVFNLFAQNKLTN